MINQRNILIITLMAMSLTGCASNENNSDRPESQAVSPVESVSTSVLPQPAELASQSPAPESSQIAEPQTQAAQSPLYRMNEVYRFVPLEETTPNKAVLLTFDDGPKDEAVIMSLLDTLDKHHAKAIFFVNGYRVKQHPELLKLLHERGGTIGNHSYDHINLKKEKASVVEKQLIDVQTSVEQLIGEKPKFFRPPFGAGNDTVKEIVNKHGMLYMTWSNGSLDWESSAKDKPEVVIRNVMEQLHPGANILMHELPWTAKALDELLSSIKAEGYDFIDPSTIQLTN